MIGQMLDPLPVEDFFHSLGREWLSVGGNADHPRARIFGADPRRTILDAYRTHAATLESHAVSPTQPPPDIGPVEDAEALRLLIQSLHARDYTVVVPDVVALSPSLQRFARALEFMLHQTVAASLFWSKAGAKAIVHYDRRDNIVMQLAGEKRWFISTDPPGLQNNWKHIAEPLPQLQRHGVVDLRPGDLLYIPRGTPHTVESASESLHLAILFTPLTLRDVIIAAVDHHSDADPLFRETALPHMEAGLGGLSQAVAKGLAALLARCDAPGFIEEALRHRSSRFVGDLPALPRPVAAAGLTPASIVAHAPLAISHLRETGGLLDFSQPGSRIAIHQGAEPALRFIMGNARFAVGQIPGLSDDVRVALVERLMSTGFLRIAED